MSLSWQGGTVAGAESQELTSSGTSTEQREQTGSGRAWLKIPEPASSKPSQTAAPPWDQVFKYQSLPETVLF